MKKNNLIALFAIALSSISFVSCEGDVEPLDPALTASITPPTATSIVGTYELTAFNTSVATDLNNDGTSSTNQMSETTCFNDMTIILNSNNTFRADSKGIEVNAAGDGATCFTDPDYTGTWALNGSLLTITYTEGGEQFTETFTALGNTLKLAISGGEIVTENSGVYAYVVSNIEAVYTKQ